MANFMEMIEAQWAQGKHLCVGLDPEPQKVPRWLAGHSNAALIYGHMCGVVGATAHVAAAYKPNIAFYESLGWQGLQALEQLIDYIKAEAPGVPVILDAKRGDIGNTNEHYARMAFDNFGADAITIHPYLGWEANKPFLDRADRGIFVLCRTSNPGAGEFQNLPTNRGMVESLYQKVAKNVFRQDKWNYNGNCGLVAGATYPDEISQVRAIAPDIPLLIPGIGKQGGDLEASVMTAKHRFLINSSSGIIFADYPHAEAEKLHNNIQEALASC